MDKTFRFTLKDLLIIVIVISMFMAVVVPGLVRMRHTSGESFALGTMKMLTTGQAQFQIQAQVDQDWDGVGEYGTLDELSGYSFYRRRPGFPGCPTGQCNPRFISPSFSPRAGAVREGIGTKSGYHFRIYLPNTSGGKPIVGGVGTAAAPLASVKAANLQEEKWIAYAWPVTAEYNIRCFCASQDGEVYLAPNGTSRNALCYVGKKAVPFQAMFNAANAVDASFQGMLWFGQSNGANRATDGQIWWLAGG